MTRINYCCHHLIRPSRQSPATYCQPLPKLTFPRADSRPHCTCHLPQCIHCILSPVLATAPPFYTVSTLATSSNDWPESHSRIRLGYRDATLEASLNRLPPVHQKAQETVVPPALRGRRKNAATQSAQQDLRVQRQPAQGRQEGADQRQEHHFQVMHTPINNLRGGK